MTSKEAQNTAKEHFCSNLSSLCWKIQPISGNFSPTLQERPNKLLQKLLAYKTTVFWPSLAVLQSPQVTWMLYLQENNKKKKEEQWGSAGMVRGCEASKSFIYSPKRKPINAFLDLEQNKIYLHYRDLV